MSDYKAAFNAAAADLSAIIALLGFTKYPGVDPVLRAITDLILDKAENQVLREERDAAQANVDALAVQVLKLGGTISFAHHPVAQAGQVPEGWRRVPIEPTKEILDEFDLIIDQGAEDSKDAWRRLLDAALTKGGAA